jgi:hypothetical protein
MEAGSPKDGLHWKLSDMWTCGGAFFLHRLGVVVAVGRKPFVASIT